VPTPLSDIGLAVLGGSLSLPSNVTLEHFLNDVTNTFGARIHDVEADGISTDKSSTP
jgi:hypothetical protein